MRGFFLSAALSLLCTGLAQGQGWPESAGTAPGYPEIRQHFLQYWNGRIPPKGSGYSVFKRWEWYWSTRHLPDGTLPPANINAVEWQRYLDSHPEAELLAANSASNWTSLGPSTSNSGYYGLGRINCMAFHPTDPNTFWAGAPAGGLWKTSNGGANWTTLTDQLTVLGVSAIAIDPSNVNILYLGTGDKNAGDTYSVGVLKSTDGGTSWSTTGLSFGTSQYKKIYQLALNPASPTTLLAATSNGVYRSTDAGAGWTLTLNTTVYDLAFKPGDPNTAYACTADQLYRSTNGGASWTSVLTIPNSTRIALAVTPANAAVVAAVSTANGPFNGVYRSTNSGQSFTLQASTPNLLNGDPNGAGSGGQGWYDLCMTISPTNAATMFVGGINLWRSTNGGVSWSLVNYWYTNGPPGVAVVHADKHYLGWRGNSTLFQGCDGGVYYSTNTGTAWTDITNSLAISQIYRVGVSQSDNKIVCGLQDNGTKLRGTSGSWTDHIGGDGMDCAIHPTNSNILYSTLQRGELRRSVNGGISWTDIQSAIPGQPEGAWVTPIVLTAGGTLYAAYNDVYKTSDMGASWTALSNNLSPTSKLTLLALAPSNPAIIYAGTEEQLWRTSNGGASWTVVTGNLPTGDITSITVDPSNADRVYATVGGYLAGQKVFHSTNGGGSWTNISGTLPNLPANCLAIQPANNQTLFIGLDVGVYFRNNAMSDWVLYNTGLPKAPILDLELRNATNQLRAATYGRGLWETPILPVSNTLTVTPANQNVGNAGGAVSYSVTTSGNWTASDNQSWLWLTPAAGSNNGTFVAVFSANYAPAARVATITVTNGGISHTVTLTQAGAASPACSNDNEPANNTRSTTTPTIVPGLVKLSQIGAVGDIDFWKFSLSAAQTVGLSLTTLPFDFDLELYNEAGTLLANSVSTSTTNESIIISLPAGAYYARVNGYNGAFSASQCYTLLLTAAISAN